MIIGDSSFNLNVQNSQFSFREGADYDAKAFEGATLTSPALFNARNFDKIILRDVILEKKDSKPVLISNSGNNFTLDQVSFITGNSAIPYAFDKIGEVKKDKLKLDD